MASEPGRRCADHPQAPAVVHCTQCGRALCDACFDFLVQDRPACAPCGFEASTRRQRGLSFAITFVGLGGALAFWLYRNETVQEEIGADLGVFIGFGLVVVVVVATIIVALTRGGLEASRRDRDDPLDVGELEAPVAHPYRARARRIAMRIAPRVSGASAAAAVGAAFAVSAVALPAAFKLPRWIELELVVAAWWIVLAVTLAILLYRGYRLKDDFLFVPFWRRRSPKTSGGASGGSSSFSPDLGGCGDGCSGLDAEGCVVGLAIAVVLAVLLGAAWLIAELAVPVVLFATYALVLRALRRVAHDRHGCEGDAAKALGWGAVWATLYVLPLAAIVWGVHAATSR